MPRLRSCEKAPSRNIFAQEHSRLLWFEKHSVHVRLFACHIHIFRILLSLIWYIILELFNVKFARGQMLTIDISFGAFSVVVGWVFGARTGVMKKRGMLRFLRETIISCVIVTFGLLRKSFVAKEQISV